MASPVMTTHKIEPIGGHIVVTIEKSETERRMAAAGLAMPDSSAERDRLAMMRGTIVGAADDALYGLGNRLGDTALFGRYAGTTVKGADGDDYRLLRDEDVKAVMAATAKE